MSGENGTTQHGPRRRDYVPNIAELRRLLERATGSPRGSQARLADLVGCKPESLSSWEKGQHKPSAAYRAKLIEVEKKLKAKKVGVIEELRDAPPIPVPTPVVALPLPLVANRVVASVDADQVLLRFGLKLPGEEEPRQVAEILVPRASLEKIVLGFAAK